MTRGYFYFQLKIADASCVFHHFGAGKQSDVFVFHYFVIQARNQFLAGFFGKAKVVPLGHTSSNEKFTFDEINLRSGFCQFECRPHAGHAGPDYGYRFGSLHFHRFERLRVSHFGNGGFHHFNCFFGSSRFVIRMRPRNLFPDIGMHIIVLVQAGPFGYRPEGEQMKFGRAGSDHHAIQTLLFDIFHHLLLVGIGAGKHGCLGKENAFVAFDGLSDFFHVHIIGDISSAMTNVNSYFLFHGLALLK